MKHTNKNYLTVTGYLNAILERILYQKFHNTENEDVLNQNCYRPTEFTMFNRTRIINTVRRHPFHVTSPGQGVTSMKDNLYASRNQQFRHYWKTLKSNNLNNGQILQINEETSIKTFKIHFLKESHIKSPY